MENLLLTSELARTLYKSVVSLPIIDFHNHLPVNDIVGNRQYRDLTELWVAADPYKHRAMRICGVPEQLITGNATSKEKFLAWAQTVPKLLGNPLWHWSRLELLRVFGIEEELTPETAESIWRRTGEMLATPQYRTQVILERFNIEYAAPCCTLQDSLEPFTLNGASALAGKAMRLVPSLRGDNLLSPTPELLAQLSSRLDAFHRAGCRIADHALDAGFRYLPDTGEDRDVLANGIKDELATTSAMLRLLGQEYARRGWILQLHIGALRKTSDRLRREAGPAGGYAGIGHSCDIASISAFLNDLERLPFGLPRTILYTLNPVDHAALAVLAGSFPGDGVRGKV